MEISSKRLDIALILVVLGSLVPLTIATVFSYLGPISLVLIWLLVIVAALAVYSLSLRSRVVKFESEPNVVVLEGSRDASVIRLQEQVATLQQNTSRLEKEASEWRTTASNLKEQKFALERDVGKLKELKLELERRLAEAPSEPAVSQTVVEELRLQLKTIARFRKFHAPLDGKERTVFVNWRTRTSALLWQALPEGTTEAEDFENIEFEPDAILGVIPLGDPSQAFAKGLDEAEAILKTVTELYLA